MEIVDFHSHILPGIDDGSKSVEQSAAMLQSEAAQGIRHVVATPHFYAQYDKPDAFLQKRAEAESLLRLEMEKHPDLPIVSVGAEVYYFSGIADSQILPKLAIADTNYILVEMPMAPWSERMYKDLESIWRKRDLIPIIAHVDRYIAPFRTYGIPKRLAELPVLVQANAEFFLRHSTKNMALRMLKQGNIHLLGSDCHNLKDRNPNLGEAVELIRQKLGTRVLGAVADYQGDIFPER